MSMAAKLLGTSGGATEKLYADDVFSAYTYTGNGSTQTINNGIDLAGKGGLVWLKGRSAAYVHGLYDSVRGGRYRLMSNATNAQTDDTTAGVVFNSSGFSIGPNTQTNANTATYVSWTFRKAPKFFDVVTYTGNGVAGRQIPHSLGIAPGMVTVKAVSATGNWPVSHRSLPVGSVLTLDTTSSSSIVPAYFPSKADDSVFSVGDTHHVNALGTQYVAYLFAHDPSADGVIQCGSFTTDGLGNATVSLGWEPQYLMIKGISSSEPWYVFDVARGMSYGNNLSYLYANLSNAEIVSSGAKVTPTATGFVIGSATLSSSASFIYLAIRRPNKPPTSGTQVYNAIARTGTGGAATVTGVGFAPDLVMPMGRTLSVDRPALDRLRGGIKMLTTTTTEAESDIAAGVTAFDMGGISIGADSRINSASNTYINHFFKRAVGVMDVVCYTGTGVAKTEAHGLGVAPELMIVKSRVYAANWNVYHNALGSNGGYPNFTELNGTFGKYLGAPSMFSTTPNSIGFGVGTSNQINGAGAYVAYLFATKPGISKVGSYTGNGTSQTLDMGFTTGARFFMVKRTDATGDWFVFDTVRGIVSANDPHLSLNTTAAEVSTDDSVDPASVGIIVNQVAATNINVNLASYIYLSFA